MPTPWEEAAQLKKAKPPAADGETWTGSAIGAAKDFGRGMAKGVGNLAEELPTLGTPHVSELDPNAKKFLESPSSSSSESIGTFAGENIPFMVGGPEAAIGKGVAKAIPFAGKLARPLGELAGHALWGGAAGAAQPTKPGESRLTNALGGAATGGLVNPRVAGAVTGVAGSGAAGWGIEELARKVGWGPVLAILGAGYGLGHSHGLYSLARQAYRPGQAVGKAIGNAVPAGLAGAAGGQAAKSAQETYDVNSRP